MFSLGRWQVSIIVCCAVAVHLFWAWMIIRNEAALNATALNILFRYVHSPLLLVFLLGLSSALAVIAMILQGVYSPLLLIPQQLVLMASASATIDAVWLGQFADGVLRPPEFIASDQVWPFIIAIGHSWAVIMYARQTRR